VEACAVDERDLGIGEDCVVVSRVEDKLGGDVDVVAAVVVEELDDCVGVTCIVDTDVSQLVPSPSQTSHLS